MKLKIWTDKSYIEKYKYYVTMLIPFFGYEEPDDFIDKGRFLEYYQKGKEFFSLVEDIKECDVIVSPIPYEKKEGPQCAKELSELAKKFNKKVFVFFNSDSAKDVNIENSIIFRTSFYKSKRKSNEFALPGWSQDYLKSYFNGKLQIKEKSEKPVVGYSGYIDVEPDSFNKPVKKILKRIKRAIQSKIKGEYNSQLLRGRAVEYLSKNENLEANFIIRNGFMGLATLEVRKEFVYNIISSHYCLATRGNGNFSYRLYEIMSLGRIPLFVNTDAVLPYEEFIDYKKYFCWVEEKDLKKIAKIVLDFNNKISNEDFISLQKKIREIYEEWISPVGFHKNLWRYLK